MTGEKRLKFQTAYFKHQSERHVRRDEWWRVAHRRLTATVVIVGLHILIELAMPFMNRVLGANPGNERFHRTEILLDTAITIAALLPVIGSGIRTWRSANEASRNISRFRAKYLALRNIEQRMEGGEITETAEAEAVLRDLWCGEQIMESEHREWLRLMPGAEWLG